MKTHISPVQLFILTFLCLFSGLMMGNADSILAVFLPAAAVSLWALIGSRGAGKKQSDLLHFLGASMPFGVAVMLLALLLILTGAEGVLLLFDAGANVQKGTSFLPPWFLLAVLLFLGLYVACKGTAVVGRVGECALFLLIPVVFLHLFGDFTVPMLWKTPETIRIFFSASPAWVWFLMASTATAGDEGVSDGFRATGKPPKHRKNAVMLAVFAGALTASLLKLFFLVLPFGESELLVYFLTLYGHVVKLAVLSALILYSVRSPQEPRLIE